MWWYGNSNLSSLTYVCNWLQLYNDAIMSAVASQINSLTIVYSTCYSGADQRKHQAPRHWPLCGEFTGDRWITCTKGQQHGKCFHLMTSSCNVISKWNEIITGNWWPILQCSQLLHSLSKMYPEDIYARGTETPVLVHDAGQTPSTETLPNSETAKGPNTGSSQYQLHKRVHVLCKYC